MLPYSDPPSNHPYPQYELLLTSSSSCHGVHAVFTRCSSGVQALFTRCSSGVLAEFKRCSRTVQAVFTWCLSGVHAVFTRYSRGVDVVLLTLLQCWWRACSPATTSAGRPRTINTTPLPSSTTASHRRSVPAPWEQRRSTSSHLVCHLESAPDSIETRNYNIVE